MLELDPGLRAARLSDFEVRDIMLSAICDSALPTSLEYTHELPASVQPVKTLGDESLSIFLSDEVDGLYIERGVEDLGDGMKYFETLQLTQKLRDPGGHDYTLSGCSSMVRRVFSDQICNDDPQGKKAAVDLVLSDLALVGGFLQRARSRTLEVESPQLVNHLFNTPGVGSLFHIHEKKYFGVIGYKQTPSEILWGDKLHVTQFGLGDIFIWKGDRVLHRQPPPDNPISPYVRHDEDDFDERLVQSIAVKLSSDA